MLLQGKRAPPIILVKEGDRFRIKDGEHRFEACRIARRTHIKSVVVEAENK
jgi:ParB-like chromosome segregation protein Spo0J